jgi:predicted alpha/beta-fold hydrolase
MTRKGGRTSVVLRYLPGVMPEAFRAAWWLPGPHAQTLGARLLRSRSGEDRLRRERVELADGDFLDLDIADGDPVAPLVVVLHGLEGSARSTYVLQLYRALATQRLQVVGLNFRACSGELNRLPRMYHSGDTGDLAFVLRLLAGRFPGRPIGAVGFSLGGNVLLKYLGEERTPPAVARQAAARPEPDIRAAVAISVPFDLAAGAQRLEQGFSRVYRRYLVGMLKRKTIAKAALLDGLVSVERVRRARTFVEFDNAATGPLHGFADACDYYARSSCAQFVARITVPTLLIHAEDDPFLPAAAIPREAIAGNPALEAEITSRGGHVGFIAGPPWAPVFWAEHRAATFLARQLCPAADQAD